MTDAYREYLRKHTSCKGPVCTVAEEVAEFKKHLEKLDRKLAQIDVRREEKQ